MSMTVFVFFQSCFACGVITGRIQNLRISLVVAGISGCLMTWAGIALGVTA